MLEAKNLPDIGRFSSRPRSGSTAANEVKSCSPTMSPLPLASYLRPMDRDNATHSGPGKADRCRRDTSGSDKSWPGPTCGREIRPAPRPPQAPGSAAGKTSFKATTRFPAGMGDWVVKVATWPRACTPASVRPEPWGRTFSPGHPSNGRGQCALDRGRLGLDLPSKELRAIVGQDQFEIAHDDCLESYRARSSSKPVANLYKALRGRTLVQLQNWMNVSAILFHSIRAQDQ